MSLCKKVVAALCSLALAVSAMCTVPIASYAKKEPQRASFAYGSPVIDGEVDEIWDKTEELSAELFTETNGKKLDKSGVSLKFRGMWDADKLYFLADVTAPVFPEVDSIQSPTFENNSFIFFVDPLLSDSAQLPYFWIAFHPFGQQRYSSNVLSMLFNDNAKNLKLSDSAVIRKPDDSGYIVELSISMKSVCSVLGFDYINYGGREIRLDVSYNADLDGDGARDYRFFWSDWEYNAASETARLGTITLSPEGAPEELKAAPSTTAPVIYTTAVSTDEAGAPLNTDEVQTSNAAKGFSSLNALICVIVTLSLIIPIAAISMRRAENGREDKDKKEKNKQ